MAPINQINRLTKLPHLLNKKREAEKGSKKNKKDQDAPPFPPEDKSFLKKSDLKKLEKPKKREGKAKSADESVGSNLDLTI